MSSAYGVTKRPITLADYDDLPDASYRERIEEVISRALTSEHVRSLLAPRGSVWPMDIFCAARGAIDRDPAISVNTLYFDAVSAVLCRALSNIRTPPSVPVPDPPTIMDRRALQKHLCSSVRNGPGHPRHPLRIQLLKHMHLKWTISMNRKEHTQYNESDSDEDPEELELILTTTQA